MIVMFVVMFDFLLLVILFSIVGGLFDYYDYYVKNVFRILVDKKI